MKEQQKRKIQQFYPEIEDGIDLRRCPLQGFNTGVALYHLGRMRESLEYTIEVDVERMHKLSNEKYLMPGTLGDQVWISPSII